MRAAVPIARVLYIEPDIFDPGRAAAASAAAAAAATAARARPEAGAGALIRPGTLGVADPVGNRLERAECGAGPPGSLRAETAHM